MYVDIPYIECLGTQWYPMVPNGTPEVQQDIAPEKLMAKAKRDDPASMATSGAQNQVHKMDSKHILKNKALLNPYFWGGGGYVRGVGWLAMNALIGWWLNQPIWKNMFFSQIGSFPQGSGWK